MSGQTTPGTAWLRKVEPRLSTLAIGDQPGLLVHLDRDPACSAARPQPAREVRERIMGQRKDVQKRLTAILRACPSRNNAALAGLPVSGLRRNFGNDTNGH